MSPGGSHLSDASTAWTSMRRRGVTVALTRLGQGNFSNVAGVGKGAFELKIDLGPGFRVYFGKDGDRIVILLGGSTKKRQDIAIAAAQAAWAEYKRRRSGKE